MKTTDILNDPLVQQVIQSQEGGKYFHPPSQEDLEDDELLQMLDKTGALDSGSAAALVSDKLIGGREDAAERIARLPASVQPAATVLADGYGHDDMEASFSALLRSGDLSLHKIGLATMAVAGSPENLREGQAMMSRAEMRAEMEPLLNIMVEAMETLPGYGTLKDLPPALLSEFVGGFERLSAFEKGGTRQKVLSEALEGFKAALDAEGIVLPAKQEPAPLAVEASLTRATLAYDPVVQSVLKAFGADAATIDFDNNPMYDALISMNTLDSVSAAVLVADELSHGGYKNPQDPAAIPQQVLDALELMYGADAQDGNVAGVLESNNPVVHKQAVAGIAVGARLEILDEKQNMSPADYREAVSTLVATGVEVADAMVAGKTWKSMSPELIDAFTDTLGELAKDAGKSHQRLAAMALQTLKTDVAAGAGADLTQPQATNDNEKPAPKTGPKRNHRLNP